MSSIKKDQCTGEYRLGIKPCVCHRQPATVSESPVELHGQTPRTPCKRQEDDDAHSHGPFPGVSHVATADGRNPEANHRLDL